MAELVVSLAFGLAEVILTQYHFDNQTKVPEVVGTANKCLRRMEAYLRDSSDQQVDESGNQVHQDTVNEVQDMAYETQDALDKFQVQVPHNCHHHRVTRVIHDVRHIPIVRIARRELSSKIKDIEEKMSTLHISEDVRPISSSNRLQQGDHSLSIHYQQVLEADEIVGFEEHKEKLVKQLMQVDYNSRLLTISIEGPGGSGKTTLAKDVFESKRVQEFFDFHAWVDVTSRPLKPEELLGSILSKFEAKRQQQQELVLPHQDTKAKLGRLVQQKRFVVVLDNVWTKEIVVGIVNALPDGLRGSKVIITTRKSDVASVCAKSSEYIHDLRNGLPWEKAWYLFCKKAFRGHNCPPELDELAQIILTKCEGLPLAISAVGTLLANKRPTTAEWRTLHDSLGSEIRPGCNLSIISRVIWQPSYGDLPSNNLKSCFLYFSMFPEDYSIRRERLIRLWIAEGFVMSSRGLTMEQVAERYLNELVGRNLVHASSREIDGQVRSCRVLNLVREFLISKAENFITVLDSNSRSTSTRSSTSGKKIRRLSVHYVGIDLSRSWGIDHLKHIRTLLVYGQTSPYSNLQMVLKTSKYVRVLDLEGTPLESFPDQIVGLTLLRYISLRQTKIKEIPKSIKKLALLETLDLRETWVTYLPEEICELHNMRHLLVNRCDHVTFGAVQGVQVAAGSNIGDLASLQKLSLINVKNNRKLIRGLAKLVGLRKLGVTDLNKEDGGELCLAVQELEHLSTLDVRSTREDEYLDLDHIICSPDHHRQGPPLLLQRLNLKGRLERLPKWISPKLDSLAKIGLRWSKLSATIANPLEALQALPNLMELDLVDYYAGDLLEFKAQTFKKLMVLSIEQFDHLKTMVVEDGAMPMLKKLTMAKCGNLELLPLGIDGLTFLDELLLYDMHSKFIARLQKSNEDRHLVQHIRVIHSFCLDSNQTSTGFQNLS